MGLFGKKKENDLKGGVSWLIVGLGNPDKKYEYTRHNAGFMAIDRIAEQVHISVDRLKFKALTGMCEIEGEKCLLMKPTTYMNLSGQAVVEAMNFYHVPIERVLVLFDDISLDVGGMRIRRKGSDGGHNGIKNIIYLTGKDTFPRVKIGVGKKPHPDYDLADWVLSKFTEEERKQLLPVLDNCVEATQKIIAGQIDQAMNLFN
jgi:PTH1 family peptidyl-tRNA hydrolase